MRSSSESGSTQAKKPTLIVLRIQGFDDITSANPLNREQISNSLPPAIESDLILTPFYYYFVLKNVCTFICYFLIIRRIYSFSKTTSEGFCIQKRKNTLILKKQQMES